MKGILAENPPLPIQEMVWGFLVHFYDDLDRRQEALRAKLALVAIRDQLDNLKPEPPASTALYQFYGLSSDRGDLGLRLEEEKRYWEAERSYQEAVDFGLKAKDKMSQAEIFLWQLGQARSLWKLGNAASAQNICSDWKNKLPTFGSELENFSWHGAELAQAEWELSCDNFAKD